MEKEKRFISSVDAEFRANNDNNKKTIEGYAAIYDVPADMGWYTEYIRAGAFAKTLKEADVRALFNHDPNQVLGRNKSGTLQLSSDKKGLKYIADLPGTRAAEDVYELISRGDVSQSSFAFKTVKDNWFTEQVTAQDGTKLTRDARELLEVRLYDISPVTYPAYIQTSVGARDMFAAQNIDIDVLNNVLFMASQKRELVPDQRKLIEKTIEILSNCLSEPGNHSEPIQPSNITVLRQRLDLIGIDIK